jgi:Transient receptor potential (TRP) ion channel
MAVLCCWEITKRDSPGEVILSILSILIMMFLLGLATIKVWKYARLSIELHNNPAYLLYSDAKFLSKWGFLYVQFQASMYYFSLPLLIYTFVKSLFIALGQSSGTVQAVALVVLELTLLLAISICRPFMDKQTNGFNISIAAVNLVNAILLLFYAGVFVVPVSIFPFSLRQY